ncbi:Atp-Binding Cassette Sub-Family C Member 8 [Manis pentadactyla]|nr:Atp-Binding Cassette Sub-Family C Member 8 [Manis pentadactyla]
MLDFDKKTAAPVGSWRLCMEVKVAGIKSLLLGMTGRCADASGVPEHSFPLFFTSVYPIRNREWWREEGSIHTEKKTWIFIYHRRG